MQSSIESFTCLPFLCSSIIGTFTIHCIHRCLPPLLRSDVTLARLTVRGRVFGRLPHGAAPLSPSILTLYIVFSPFLWLTASYCFTIVFLFSLLVHCCLPFLFASSLLSCVLPPQASDVPDFWYVDVYSSTATWGGSPLPVEGDMEGVNEGETLLIDMDTSMLKMLLINGKGG